MSSKGFDWEALPANSLVVDVGCGNGSQILKIVKRNSKLKFIAQDRLETIAQVATPVRVTFFHIGAVLISRRPGRVVKNKSR